MNIPGLPPIPWTLVAGFATGLLLVIGIGYGGYQFGSAVVQAEWDHEKLTKADHVIKVQQIVTVEVPKIVTRTVTRTVTVEKEVTRVEHVVDKSIPADCVLPDNYGMLLVAAARGIDPEQPGATDGIAGEYGCREVLNATLRDLKAGWKNTASLVGLEEGIRALDNAERSSK